MEILSKVCFYHVIVIIFVLGEERLPENLMTYDNHNSQCYGPGTHGQFKPSCPSAEYIILIESLKIGTKPLAKDCPSSVTKITTHTGSYIVDTLDHNKILDEGSCCFPEEAYDCISNYNYANSGLNYYYHTSCSGYTQCKPNMQVSRTATSCNDTSVFPSVSNYIFMNYACIKGTRIGDMCSNKTYNIFGSALYLTNSDYPNSVSSNIGFCQCNVQTNGTSIHVILVDVRLEKQGNECKQELNVSDSDRVNTWDCETATNYNITKVSKNQNATLIFRNKLQENGGQFVVGINGIQGQMVTIDCFVKTKTVTEIQTSSSAIYTSLLQNTEISSTMHKSTLQNTESTSTISTSSVQIIERSSTIHSSLLHIESTSTIKTSTLDKTESTPTMHTSSLHNTESSSNKASLQSSESTLLLQNTTIKHTSILQSSESLSTIHDPILHTIDSTSTLHTNTTQSDKMTTHLSTVYVQTTKNLSTNTLIFQTSESTWVSKTTLLQTNVESTQQFQSSTTTTNNPSVYSSRTESSTSTQSTFAMSNSQTVNVQESDKDFYLIIVVVVGTVLEFGIVVAIHCCSTTRCHRRHRVDIVEEGTLLEVVLNNETGDGENNRLISMEIRRECLDSNNRRSSSTETSRQGNDENNMHYSRETIGQDLDQNNRRSSSGQVWDENNMHSSSGHGNDEKNMHDSNGEEEDETNTSEASGEEDSRATGSEEEYEDNRRITMSNMEEGRANNRRSPRKTNKNKGGANKIPKGNKKRLIRKRSFLSNPKKVVVSRSGKKKKTTTVLKNKKRSFKRFR